MLQGSTPLPIWPQTVAFIGRVHACYVDSPVRDAGLRFLEALDALAEFNDGNVVVEQW